MTQYLPDADLGAMLAEARRMLKPGGLLVIRDTEGSALRLHPIPRTLLWWLPDALARRSGWNTMWARSTHPTGEHSLAEVTGAESGSASAQPEE